MSTQVTIPEEKRQKTLDATVKDGFAYSMQMGFGERNVQTFAASARVSESTFGVVSSLSSLAGGIFQVIGANVADSTRRRKIYFVAGGIVQAFSWGILLAAVYAEGPWKDILLILSQIVYLASTNFTIPPWNSVMGDVVPEDRRGRFFGNRNFWIGVGQLISFTLASILLDYLKPLGLVPLGFSLLFFSAFLCRMLSVYYVSKMYEPPYLIQPSDNISLVDFIRRAPQANFGRFVFYVAWVSFGVSIAGIFFGYYMLKYLQWSYTDFMIATSFLLISNFVSQPFWGRLADRKGNRFVMGIGGIGVGLIPIFMLLSADKFYIFFLMIYDGSVWAAFQLATSNYLLESVPPARRAKCTAYNVLFLGIGSCLGALIGGILMGVLPSQFSFLGFYVPYPFYLLLIISALMRLVPSILILPTVNEVRLKPQGVQDWVNPGSR